MARSLQGHTVQPEELAAAARILSGHAAPFVDDSVRESVARELARLAAPGGAVFHARSLTRSGGALFIALDAGASHLLLQVGGSPCAAGLAAPAFSGSFAESPVHLYPFGETDDQNLLAFAERIDPAFLPRPQRGQPAIAAGNRHPAISLPAVFQAFLEILNESGVNLASTVQLSASREMATDGEIARRDGETPTAPGHTRVSIRSLYFSGLCAAIRAGYRHGYTAEADHFIVNGSDDRQIAESVEGVEEAIEQAARYTKFTTDASRLFDLRADARHPWPWSASEVDELFQMKLSAAERRWALSEFSRDFARGEGLYRFEPPEIKRLAVKFGPSLKLNERLYDAIVRVKAGAPFDFEPSLDEAETLTTAKELIFCMHWLRERGRPAQLVPPNLGFKKRQAYPETREALAGYVGDKMWPELLPRVDREFRGRPLDELRARIRELADVARFFDGTLSVHSGSGKQAQVLECIGAATSGRLNYKISGELQLQLFDVLAEQPPGSESRRLVERMIGACERFAEAGAFGEESKLAAFYRAAGRGSYLGDASRGRADGNLFLVFWLGNMVGSRDQDGVFFKDKLDALPAGIVAEARRRNTAYVKWLAANLMGSRVAAGTIV